MSNNRAKLSSLKQRVEWLVEHKDLWFGWYENHTHGIAFYCDRKGPWFRLIRRMKEDGLYSKTTHPLGIKLKKEMYSAAKIIRIQNEKNLCST
jgi:hypothetical protein